MKKGIKVLIGFVLAIALAGSGFWLVHRFIESKEQQANFRELAESVLIEQPSPSPPLVESDGASSKPSSEETMSPAQATPAPSPAPEVLHDLGALKEKNAQCAGWIRVPGTDIDYPFMWTPEDPERYLRRDFYGNYSDYGVPFLDHRCDLASDNLILYGHNMFDGTMFTDLLWYREREYMEDHSQIILETPEGAREYRVIAVCQANSVESKLYRHINFTDAAGRADFLDAVREDSVFFAGADDRAERFITLSTCDVSRRNGRVAVVGELVQ